MRWAVSAAMALACSACASAFPIPAGSPTATITFVARPSPDRNLAQLNFARMSGENLLAPGYKEEHFLALIIQPDAIPVMFVANDVKLSEDVVFPAAEPIFIRVSGSLRPADSRWSGYSHYCANGVSFTPQAEHRYRFTQIVEGERCTVEVIDMANQKAPADLHLFDPDIGRRRS